MKKLIIKSNEWYNNLPEPKRSIFFIIVLLVPLIGAQYLMIVKNFIWTFPTWCVLFAGWRISYLFILWTEEYKKLKNK